MKKSTRYAALAVALLPLTAGISGATTIFNDTFDSGTGAWYKADTTGTTTLSNSSQQLSWAVGGAANMSEVIGRSFSEQSLTVGETLRLTFDFTQLSPTAIIRAGFYDLTGRTATADDWSGAASPAGDFAGYTSFLRDNSASANASRQETNTFTGAENRGPTVGFDGAALGTSSIVYDINDDGTITYQAMFELTRTSAGQMDTLFSLSTGATTHMSVAGVDTTSPYTTFDTVVLRAASGTVEYDNIHLEVIPEPSSMALLGLGGLALVLRRRK